MAKGLSQVQLAKAAGMSRPNLNRIEKGRQDISRESLEGIISALGVTWEALGGSNAHGTPPLRAPPTTAQLNALAEFAKAIGISEEAVEVMRLLPKASPAALKLTLNGLRRASGVASSSLDKKKLRSE